MKMTGRYARRIVPLEIRGISTDKYVGHPPVSETIREYDDADADADADDNDSHFDESDDSHFNFDATVETGKGSPFLRKTTREGYALPFGGCRGGHSTESFTERSSLYSFADDEFDRQSSQNVQKLFDDIDLMLFERSLVGPQHLRSECDDWVSNFPHLRIVGIMKITPQDVGYKFYEKTETAADDLTPRNFISDEMRINQELVVTGLEMKIRNIYDDDSCEHDDDSSDCSSWIHEEIILKEGQIEEILAIDVRSGPNAEDNFDNCIRKDIVQNLFHEFWADIISVFEELLLNHLQHFIFNSGHNYSVDRCIFHEGSDIPFNPTDVYLTRESTNASIGRHILTDHKTSNVNVVSTVDRKLEEVLKISSKALQMRDKNSYDHDAASEMTQRRPVSSGPLLPISGRPFYNNNSNNLKEAPRGGGGVSDGLPSGRSRGTTKSRLAPIDQMRMSSNMEDEKHLNLSNQIIRGYKMTTLNDRFTSAPPTPLISSTSRGGGGGGPLPPITKESNYNNNNTVFHRKASLRVRSAMPNKGYHGLDLRPGHDLVRSGGEKTSMSSDSRSHRTIHNLSLADQPHVFGGYRRSSTTLGVNSLHSNKNQRTDSGVTRVERKLSVMGNRIPEYDDDDSSSVHDIINTSAKFVPTYKRFLHNNILRHIDAPLQQQHFSSGRSRAAQSHFNAPVR